MNELTEKYDYSITQDGITSFFHAQKVGYSYPQTDGDGAGATDENVMYLDPLPERMTFIAKYDVPSEEETVKLLQCAKKRNGTIRFFDFREQKFVDRICYIVLEDIEPEYLIDGEFVCNSYEVSFIQQIPDEYVQS